MNPFAVQPLRVSGSSPDLPPQLERKRKVAVAQSDDGAHDQGILRTSGVRTHGSRGPALLSCARIRSPRGRASGAQPRSARCSAPGANRSDSDGSMDPPRVGRRRSDTAPRKLFQVEENLVEILPESRGLPRATLLQGVMKMFHQIDYVLRTFSRRVLGDRCNMVGTTSQDSAVLERHAEQVHAGYLEGLTRVFILKTACSRIAEAVPRNL